MNSSNRIINHTNCSECHHDSMYAQKLLNTTQMLNTFMCSILIVIGIVSNLLIFCVLKLKCYRKRFNKRNLFKSTSTSTTITKPTSLSTSQTYILALAFSDLLFIISHSFEDIMPNIAALLNLNNKVLLLTDRNNIICKLILYVRNASRVSSSYLIIFFALERLMVVSKPLERLKFHYKKFNRNLTIIVFLFSFIFTAYTPIISGLRKIQKHEKVDENNIEYTCDTLNEYKYIYDYITIIYILVVMIIPIFAISYLNFYIVKVLMTRKNCIIRRYFKAAKSPPSSSHDSAFEASSVEIKRNNSTNFMNDNTAQVAYQLPTSLIDQINTNNSIILNTTNNLNCVRKCASFKRQNRILKGKSHSIDLSRTMSESIGYQNYYQNQPQTQKQQQEYDNDYSIKNFNLINLYHTNNLDFKRKIIKSQTTSLLPSRTTQTTTTATTTTTTSLIRRRSSSLVSTKTLNNKNQESPDEKSNYYFRTHTQDNSCWIFRHSRLFFKLKEAGRATFILILISVSFIILNLPYLIAWLCFFVPFKYDLLPTKESKQKRFSYVYITEIFHIANYCINFFLYCFSSKIFRQELKLMLIFIFKPLLFCKKSNYGVQNNLLKTTSVTSSYPGNERCKSKSSFVRYGSASSTSGGVAPSSLRFSKSNFNKTIKLTDNIAIKINYGNEDR